MDGLIEQRGKQTRGLFQFKIKFNDIPDFVCSVEVNDTTFFSNYRSLTNEQVDVECLNYMGQGSANQFISWTAKGY